MYRHMYVKADQHEEISVKEEKCDFLVLPLDDKNIFLIRFFKIINSLQSHNCLFGPLRSQRGTD